MHTTRTRDDLPTFSPMRPRGVERNRTLAARRARQATVADRAARRAAR